MRKNAKGGCAGSSFGIDKIKGVTCRNILSFSPVVADTSCANKHNNPTKVRILRGAGKYSRCYAKVVRNDQALARTT